MTARLRNLLLCIALVSGNASSSYDAAVVPAEIRVEIENGQLNLEARDAPLHQVMHEIGKIAGFQTVLVGSFVEPLLVSVSFENLPVREAVERLVRAENRIIVFAPSTVDTGNKAIAQVLLLQAGTTPTDMTFAENQSIASGSEADVRAYKLAQLVAMLQPEQVEEVRIRAAMALGNFQDKRAVKTLESALFDNFPAVRLQAINALGRIGNEQASEALINLLRNGDTDEADKLSATRALSLHDTSNARNFFHAGGNTTDSHTEPDSTSESLSLTDADNKKD
ncbi:MAG: HEAT repeat domain-containing protein [Gammaproteobacteria bacterium]|nr:HEAT repeat domain-containing protein [Gammaproteobacteria bacterium]